MKSLRNWWLKLRQMLKIVTLQLDTALFIILGSPVQSLIRQIILIAVPIGELESFNIQIQDLTNFNQKTGR